MINYQPVGFFVSINKDNPMKTFKSIIDVE